MHPFTLKHLAVCGTVLMLAILALPALAEDEGTLNVSADASVSVTATTSAGVRTIRPGTESTRKLEPRMIPANRPNAASMRPTASSSMPRTEETKRSGGETNRITSAKANADKQIMNRINSLNALIARIQGMAHVSDPTKASLQVLVEEQISILTILKNQIAAETVTSALKTDIESITKSYRIYALIEPQIRILAAADRAFSIADMMESLSAKLSVRITSAEAGGKDMSSLNSLLADLNAKIAAAKLEAQAAIDASASLKPDNGDTTTAQANKAALKNARSKIEAAQKDLKAAHEDAVKIVKGLRGKGGEGKATGTVDTKASGSIE